MEVVSEERGLYPPAPEIMEDLRVLGAGESVGTVSLSLSLGVGDLPGK